MYGSPRKAERCMHGYAYHSRIELTRVLRKYRVSYARRCSPSYACAVAVHAEKKPRAKKLRNKNKAKTQKRDALPVAREKLFDAINDLIHIRRYTLQPESGRLKRVKLLSRYDELVESVEAHRGGHGGHWQGQLPFWADALVLVLEVDAAVLKMCPHPHRWRGWTEQRLIWLEQQKWTPQETAKLFRMASELQGFVKRIDTLFAPKPIPLKDPCPECGEKTAYREGDEKDKPIRVPALQINDAGCTCGNCSANWPVERLPLLGKLLEDARSVVEC